MAAVDRLLGVARERTRPSPGCRARPTPGTRSAWRPRTGTGQRAPRPLTHVATDAAATHAHDHHGGRPVADGRPSTSDATAAAARSGPPARTWPRTCRGCRGRGDRQHRSRRPTRVPRRVDPTPSRSQVAEPESCGSNVGDARRPRPWPSSRSCSSSSTVVASSINITGMSSRIA